MNEESLSYFKERLLDCYDLDDTEIAHRIADGVLCDMLTELGYNDIVELFNYLEKWYA